MLEAPPYVRGALGNYLADPVFTVVVFFAVFVGLYIVGRSTVEPIVRRALDRKGVDRHARRPLMRITRFLVVFVAFGAAFAAAGFGSILTSLATIAAAATLAIGLATQNVIRNFVSGVFIYTERPFKIDDWIEWDNATYSGVVEEMVYDLREHEIVFVEGQAALTHRIYGGVTLSILGGAWPDAVVLTDDPDRERREHFESFSVPPVTTEAALVEELSDAAVTAISTWGDPETVEYGVDLPVANVYHEDGPARLLDMVLHGLRGDEAS
ncbi:MAG: DUF1611 domain-containing protein [Halobacteriales archaeon]